MIISFCFKIIWFDQIIISPFDFKICERKRRFDQLIISLFQYIVKEKGQSNVLRPYQITNEQSVACTPTCIVT